MVVCIVVELQFVVDLVVGIGIVDIGYFDWCVVEVDVGFVVGFVFGYYVFYCYIFIGLLVYCG